MKKLLLFYWAMAVSITSFSQLSSFEGKETFGKKIKFGIKTGISVATCHKEYDANFYTNPPEARSITGAIGGVFLQVSLNNKVCFQPELQMIGKGMKTKDENNISYPEKITYLELPLNILYKPVSAKGSFFIGGGPAPAFYIGENVFYSSGSAIKKFDFGINFLTGYELPIGFSINLHYTHGLTNISSDKTFIPVMKNRCFGITIGYVF
jgi:hypothetical protein